MMEQSTDNISISTSYLHSVYRPRLFKVTVKRTVSVVRGLLRRKAMPDIDAIAFRGSSGAALAFPVSAQLGVPLIHVRKDRGHHGAHLEGRTKARGYIIIDDFAQSGNTIRKIIETIRQTAEDYAWPDPVCRAIVFYNECHGNRSGGELSLNDLPAGLKYTLEDLNESPVIMGINDPYLR